MVGDGAVVVGFGVFVVGAGADPEPDSDSDAEPDADSDFGALVVGFGVFVGDGPDPEPDELLSFVGVGVGEAAKSKCIVSYIIVIVKGILHTRRRTKFRIFWTFATIGIITIVRGNHKETRLLVHTRRTVITCTITFCVSSINITGFFITNISGRTTLDCNIHSSTYCSVNIHSNTLLT